MGLKTKVIRTGRRFEIRAIARPGAKGEISRAEKAKINYFEEKAKGTLQHEQVPGRSV